MKKKFLSVVLSLCMIVSCMAGLNISAGAGEGGSGCPKNNGGMHYSDDPTGVYGQFAEDDTENDADYYHKVYYVCVYCGGAFYGRDYHNWETYKGENGYSMIGTFEEIDDDEYHIEYWKCIDCGYIHHLESAENDRVKHTYKYNGRTPLNGDNEYHLIDAECTECGHKAALTEKHSFYSPDEDLSTLVCNVCGYTYKPKYYVTLKYTLADGVDRPKGFVEQEKKGPFDRGTEYTAYAKSYDGLKAKRLSGSSSGMMYEDVTVEYTYEWADPCPEGKNHNRQYVKVDDNTHKYYCTKCNEVFSTGSHDKNGDSARSYETCQFACSQCGFKKTFPRHNFEKYQLSGKDGGEGKTLLVCLNCDYQTECMHEWETEEYQEDGRWHSRVCKLCGYEEAHVIDCEGSWLNVATKDTCRVPCCRKCHQAVPSYDIGIENLAELCHQIIIEPNGTSTTHRAYCFKCGYVFSERAPCFDSTDWLTTYGDDLGLEEMEDLGSKYLHENGNGTATITCVCGNQKTVDVKGKIIGTSHIDLEVYNWGELAKNPGFVSTETQIFTDEMFSELLKSIAENEKLKQEIEEKQKQAGIEDLEQSEIVIEDTASKVTLVEETKTTQDENGDPVQTAKVDITKAFKVTVTSGDKSFTTDGDFNLLVDRPTNICIPAPEGFGNVGDVVKVDHEHRGEHYTYYGKIATQPMPDGSTTKVVTWLSEKGLSPFTLIISKAATEEYKEYMKDKLTTLITTFGDVNGDKLIDAKDVLAIRKFLVNDIPAEFLARFADVNADGEVTAQDVLKLRKYLVDAGNVILGEK